MRLRLRLACLLLLALPGIRGGPASAAPAATGAAGARALALLNSGQPERALAAFDSLAAADPRDQAAAYWGARAAELAGHEDLARCRYLSLEGRTAGAPVSLLAGARRQALEKELVESLLSLGLDRTGPNLAVPGLILLSPPDDLGPGTKDEAWGLAWTYLLFEALRGTQLCPVSMPEMLTVLDLLSRGHAARAGRAITSLPVNTVAGLRARLALLCSADGQPYLPAGAPAEEQLADGLRQFQSEHGLPATGDPDVPTQAEVERSLERWLSELPPPLEPKLLSRAAEVTGASMVLRGTFSIELGRVSVNLTLLDPAGAPLGAAPISMNFPLEQTAQRAAEAARLLAGHVYAVPPATLSAADLEEAARTLLMLDRGLKEAAERRWQTSPARWFDWPLLASARRAVALDAADLKKLEASLAGAWQAGPAPNAAAAQDLFLHDLDGGWSRPWPALRAEEGRPPLLLEDGPYSVVGNDGLLHVRGSRP